jgi:hypothetical protein
MFELTKAKVKLTSINARAEIHGEDRKPAFDIMFEAKSGNDVLTPFHSELRSMLYKKNETPDLVDQVEGDALTALRFPKMGTIKWEQEYTGYTVTVDYGLGGKSDIKLAEVKLDKFKFIPQEGGTVAVIFRVIAHPETEDVGRLCEFIQREVEITITPPEPTSVHELFGEQKAA